LPITLRNIGTGTIVINPVPGTYIPATIVGRRLCSDL